MVFEAYLMTHLEIVSQSVRRLAIARDYPEIDVDDVTGIESDIMPTSPNVIIVHAPRMTQTQIDTLIGDAQYGIGCFLTVPTEVHDV